MGSAKPEGDFDTECVDSMLGNACFVSGNWDFGASWQAPNRARKRPAVLTLDPPPLIRPRFLKWTDANPCEPLDGEAGSGR